MRMYDIILKKRRDGELSKAEIDFAVHGFNDGQIPAEQMSALLMAIMFNGMSKQETVDLTLAMADSGEVVDLSGIGLTVDKHSTGGVGDKTTFIITPIVASLGVHVAKMSGRGLGHTGGTSDKIESIPNIKIDFTEDEFLNIVKRAGACLATQSADLAPADKKIYALRDITATVDNLSLIAASVMSKKIAAGSGAIVLDVKYGSGAFMKTAAEATELAQIMVDIGKGAGRKTMALITDMSEPTGFAIGNTLEMIEAIETLQGNGPSDLTEICIELATNMHALATGTDLKESRALALSTLSTGRAFEQFKTIIEAQGGDTSYLDDVGCFETASLSQDIVAETSGFVHEMNAESIGIASCLLGAGRLVRADTIDLAAGIILNKKVGDAVSKGDVLATLYTNDLSSIKSATDKFLEGYLIKPEPKAKKPLIETEIR